MFTAYKPNRWFFVSLACIVLAVRCPSASAYTPESTEVKAMVERGIAFLEKADKQDGYYIRLGGKCLVGMAVFKWTNNYQHPLVQAAVKACKDACQNSDLSQEDNYSVGLALIFLCEADPAINKREVEKLLQTLLTRQKSHGGWGYPEKTEGDTSQHQYTVLGTWMAARSGFEVPLDAKERACLWLMRVIGPDGGYGYQGQDPGSFQRIAQTEQRLSLQAAAMGSLYICMELLGFVDGEQDENSQNKLIPGVLKKRDQKKKKGPLTDKIPIATLKQVLADGNRYFASNYKADCGQYQFYYMYGLERYSSFRELAEGNKDKEPKWYNDGVNFLKATQNAQGGWSRDYYGAMCETSFACLFLMRGTKKTIQRIVEESGIIKGNKGLPDDLTEVRQDRNGTIVAKKAAPLVEDLLSMLEDQNTPLNEFLDGMPDQLELAADPTKRAQQIARLRRLAISGPFQSRLTAVKTLSRIRDLDNAPPLIFAITDPDVRIARAAADGLRFLSRKFDGPMPPEGASEQQKKAMANIWKDWYRGVRPDGSLIE